MLLMFCICKLMFLTSMPNLKLFPLGKNEKRHSWTTIGNIVTVLLCKCTVTWRITDGMKFVFCCLIIRTIGRQRDARWCCIPPASKSFVALTTSAFEWRKYYRPTWSATRSVMSACHVTIIANWPSGLARRLSNCRRCLLTVFTSG